MKLNRWLVVFLYILLIFATIPYVPRIWGVFTEPLGKNISAVLNVIYFVAACCIVLYSYLKLKKKSFTFYAALGLIFLCYGYLLKGLNIPIEKIHLLEYGLLSFLIYWAIKPKKEGILIYGVILGMVFLVGGVDELVQKITPGRVCEFRDVLLNWKAGILGFLLVLTFKKR
ncbi:MAG: VanZ family protein [Candidatus Omnitrophota bacterium]